MSEKENNTLKTVAKVAAGTAVAGIAAYGSFSYYIFRQAFDVEKSKFFPVEDVKNTLLRSRNNEWLSNSTKSDEYIQSYDRVQLHALKVRNHPESHKWIIFLHGFKGSSLDMLDYMYEADTRGFNMLSVDLRACGLSKGKYTTLGWSEHYDLISWASYIVEIDPSAEIVLYGVSVGGSAVMAALGEYLGANIKCAVEDSGFSNIKDEITYIAKNSTDLPSAAFIPGVDLFTKQILHFSIYDVNILDQLKQANIPVFFAHANDDSLVPESMMEQCYESCASEKEKKLYDNVNHAGCHNDPEYFNDVFGFISKYVTD